MVPSENGTYLIPLYSNVEVATKNVVPGLPFAAEVDLGTTRVVGSDALHVTNSMCIF